MRTALPALAFCCALLSGAEKGSSEPVTLLDPEGRQQVFQLTGKPTAVIFLSSVCPISNEYVDRMIRLWRDYGPRGIQLLFVNSNVNESAGEVREHAAAAGFPFPVYRDIRNGLADRVGASMTPEAFLLDRMGTVRYQGAIDDARNPARVKARYLGEGIEALLAGKPLPRAAVKATGCTIKRERKAS